MGLGLTTQLQRQVGTQIAKLIIFTPSRVNLNKRNSIHPCFLCVLAWCFGRVRAVDIFTLTAKSVNIGEKSPFCYRKGPVPA